MRLIRVHRQDVIAAGVREAAQQRAAVPPSILLDHPGAGGRRLRRGRRIRAWRDYQDFVDEVEVPEHVAHARQQHRQVVGLVGGGDHDRQIDAGAPRMGHGRRQRCE
jgi:hypothetical protein